jgi:hypothetical protein
MKINVQKLRGMKFQEDNVPPYGNCIIVPGDKFDPDWECLLEDQGHPCVFTDIAGKKVTLVRLMGEKASSAKMARLEEVGVGTPKTSTESRPAVSTVKPPPKRIPQWLVKNPEHQWGDDDDKKLVILWNQKPRLSVPVIAKEFPKRTLASVYGEVAALQRAHVIEQRLPRKHPKPPRRKPGPRAKTDRAEKIPGIPALEPGVVEAARVVEVSSESGGGVNLVLQLTCDDYKILGKPTVVDVVTVTLGKRSSAHA